MPLLGFGFWPFLLGVGIGPVSLVCGLSPSFLRWVALLSSVVGPMPTLRERRARSQPPFQEGPTSTETKKGGPSPYPKKERPKTRTSRRQGQPPHPKKEGPNPNPKNHQHEKDGRAREGEARPRLKREGPTALQQGKANPNSKKAVDNHHTPRRFGKPFT